MDGDDGLCLRPPRCASHFCAARRLLPPHPPTTKCRLARRFKDPRLRALFTFQDLYVGLSPYTAAGVFSLLAATEITDGVHYPVGGFQTVRDGLLRAAEANGVRVRTGARVARIVVAAGAEGGRARAAGVVLEGGEEIAADAVVTNVDVATSLGLVGSSSGSSSSLGGSSSSGGDAAGPLLAHAARRRARLEAAEYSAGVIAFNWAVAPGAAAGALAPLLHHNVFLSGDFEASWRRARRPEELARCPNFYLHCPTRTDPSAAPPGGHSVMVLLPVANEQERGGDDDYGALVAAGRAAVLRALREAGAGDLEAPGAIADEFVITPPQWRARYGLAHGAAFGLSHGLNQLSLLRPGPEDPNLPGLFFCGASARPGNGVPLTMLSGQQTAGRVARALGLKVEAAAGGG